MVEKRKKISWDNPARLQFRNAIIYIRKQSYQNAENVKKEILATIDQLAAHPEKYAPDKYKLNNKGNYRAFEIYHFRISYLVKEDSIIITRFRHTSMDPQSY